MSQRWCPPFQKGKNLVVIVVVAILKLACALRVEKLSVRVENKNVGISFDGWILGEELLVLIFHAEVHLNDNEILVKKCCHIPVLIKERVELTTPRAPFAADVQQNSLTRF